jgi:hypothetical protein
MRMVLSGKGKRTSYPSSVQLHKQHLNCMAQFHLSLICRVVQML